MNESAHIHNVFAFLSFFAIVFFLTWITKPRKISVNRNIRVSDIPLKPNSDRKPGTVRHGDIMVGWVACDE